MHSNSIFPCIIKMIPNLRIFFIFQRFIFKFLFTNITDLCIFTWSPMLLLIASLCFFLKLIIFIACSLKDSQNFFIQSLALFTSFLFSMLLHDDIVDIEKSDGICWLTFSLDEFPGLVLHPSIHQDLHK